MKEISRYKYKRKFYAINLFHFYISRNTYSWWMGMFTQLYMPSISKYEKCLHYLKILALTMVERWNNTKKEISINVEHLTIITKKMNLILYNSFQVLDFYFLRLFHSESRWLIKKPRTMTIRPVLMSQQLLILPPYLVLLKCNSIG